MTRVLVEALEAIALRSTATDRKPGHAALTDIHRAATAALAAHRAAPPLWKRPEVVEAVARAVAAACGRQFEHMTGWARGRYRDDAVAALRALAEYERGGG